MKTLKSKLEISGIGLMSGVETTLEIRPGESKGIRFHIGGSTIEANLENIVSTEHCVVLGDVAALKSGMAPDKIAKVALIEHFMAACAICDIEGLDVYLLSEQSGAYNQLGYELPILDGSAKIWVEKFNEIGVVGEPMRKTCLSYPLNFIKGKSSISLVPQEGDTTITYMVNFNHPELKNRWASLMPGEDGNIGEILEARTFGYLKDLETFQKMGFSKGVTIDNTVGMTENGYTTTLRSEFEPVKHKILDIIGDLYLTGVNPLKLCANITVKEAGHALHVEAAKLLKEQI